MFKNGDTVEVIDFLNEWYGELGEVIYKEMGFIYVGLDEAFDLVEFSPHQLKAVHIMEVKTTMINKLWSK